MVDDIMKYENTLPPNFTGVFHFTNSWDEEEFVGKWGNKEYHFPSHSTSPMIIPEHSPLEIQHIRKKFAKDWAEQDFFKYHPKYGRLMRQEKNDDGTPRLNSIQQAGTYTIDDLAEGIQKCLNPLEIKEAFISKVEEIPMEDKLSRNADGELNTKALQGKESLKARALGGEGLPS